jgi:hypothetical protein
MTIAHSPCDAIATTLSGLFSCAQQGPYVRVRTPYLYPDGDIIDLFVRYNDAGGGSVSDLGETVAWLRMQTVAERRTDKQTAIIKDVTQTHGVEFFKGMLGARFANGENPTDAIVRTAQACIRVSDLWFTFRNRSVQSFQEEVSEFLTERHIPFQPGPRLVGRSTKIWTPDFQVKTDEQSSFIYTLATGSRGAATNIIKSVVTQLYDLNHVRYGEPVEFISLFDDTVNIWSQEDFDLVADLSKVARWSERNKFEAMLHKAA